MNDLAVRKYYGSGTPEDMDVDTGVQELAARVLLAALKDKYGHAHTFQFTGCENPKGGNRKWRELRNTDDERWRDFEVSVAEVEEFEASPAFDDFVALMGGSPARWHEIFRGYGEEPDRERLLEAARLRED